MIRRLFAAAVASLSLFAAANACEPTVQVKRVTTWEPVTTWETRREAYAADFSLKDECGREFVVTRTAYRDVRVPVTHHVPVTKWVKVAY